MFVLSYLHKKQVSVFYLCFCFSFSHQCKQLIKTEPQFSSVAQSCPTLCNPMNCSTLGLPTHHQLPEFTQTHVHWVSDAIPSISHSLGLPLFLSLWVIWILNSNCYQDANTFYTLVVFPSSQKNYFPPSHPHCHCSGSFELSTDTKTVFKTLLLPNQS